MHSHSESPQPFAPPPQERYDLNARRSTATTTVSDPHAEARTRRHSLNSRVSLPSAGALGGIVVTVILAGHEGTHPVFKTTITKTNTANRRGNTTVLNKRFGEFRHLYEKVCYLNLHGSSICFKVFRFILALALSLSMLFSWLMQVQSISKLKRRYENPIPSDSFRSKFAMLGGGLSADELHERAAGLQEWLAELLNRSIVENWGVPTQAAIADFVKAPRQTAEESANAATSLTSSPSLGEAQLLPPPPPFVEASPQGSASTDTSMSSLGRLSFFRNSCLAASAAEDRSLTPPKSSNIGAVATFEGIFYWRPSRGLLTQFLVRSDTDWRPARWRVVWLSSSKEEAVLLRFDDNDLSETSGCGASLSTDGSSGMVAGNESLRIPLRSVRLVEEVRGSRVEDEGEEDDGMDLSVSMRSAATIDASGSSGEGTATGSSGHSDDPNDSSHGAADTLDRNSIMPAFRSFSVSGSTPYVPKPALFEFALTLMDGKQIFMAATDAKEREEMIVFLQSTLLRMAYKGRHDDVDLVHAVHQERHQRASQASLPSASEAGRVYHRRSSSVDGRNRKVNSRHSRW